MGSGTSRRPRSFEELFGWITAELDKLRRRTFLDTGDWVVEQADDGSLIATHGPTGVVRTLAAPP